jgi:hypothetical protein
MGEQRPGRAIQQEKRPHDPQGRFLQLVQVEKSSRLEKRPVERELTRENLFGV